MAVTGTVNAWTTMLNLGRGCYRVQYVFQLCVLPERGFTLHRRCAHGAKSDAAAASFAGAELGDGPVCWTAMKSYWILQSAGVEGGN